jgi:PAS domain S-box-containing protein
MPNRRPPSTTLNFMAGPGEMAARIRAFDWASTPLGDPASWPAGLKTTVRTILSTRLPAVIFWGPRLLCLYNDAYGALLGAEKHPRVLGMPAREAYPEIWAIVGSEIESVLAGADATWHENRLVPIERHGRLDQVYWTYSYSGIEDEAAPSGVGGVLSLFIETTSQIMESRRAKDDWQKLAQLFEQAPVFMAHLQGPDHRFDVVNRAYLQLVGHRDVLGRPLGVAVPEAVDQGYVDLVDRVFRTGQPYSGLSAAFERPADRAGQHSETRHIDFICEPTFTAEGEANGVLVVGVDVTERLRAERALATSEEQLRLATDAGEVGLWDVDMVSDTLYWPPRVRAMFGIFSDRPVTLQDDFLGSLHPEDRDATSAAYGEAVDPEIRALYDVEYRTVGREDGIVRWVAAKGRGVFDTSGRCIRVLGTAIDITAGKRDEARLKELNETLEKRLSEYLDERRVLAEIVDEADTFIQVADRDFNWLAVNRSAADEFQRLYGARPRVGANMLALLEGFPAERERVRAIWQRGMDSEGFIEAGEFGDPSVERRVYEMHFRPLVDRSGHRIGAYQFVYDVTERRAAESRLLKAEAALQQAQKLEAVGLLTGGIAHDFNNLLQALSTKFELIRRRPLAPEVVEWAASGVEVTKRGARLTAQLLTFSRHQELDVRPISLQRLFDELADLLRTTVGGTVRIALERAPVWVHADLTQLEMAVLNLALNARDAMPQGGELHIGCKVASGAVEGLPPGSYVELMVRDTGSGMSAEVMAKAFEPFFTTKGVGKGSGLGLSQVYGMARRAGGTVRIESDGRTGTTVIVVLRRADEIKEAVQRGSRPARSGETAPLSVLVVDDDTTVRESVVDSLRSLGHQVIQATDGETGLAHLDQNSVDVMLVDFAMPVMNGATLARLARIRKPDLPIIFMSGYADVSAIHEAVGSGATLLRKPFDISVLQRALERPAR